jgi:starch synthase (maltosyl-transferring)
MKETDERTLTDSLSRRVWVRNVRPCVDGGAFAIKRTVGESVDVSADVFCDGHDKLAAVVRYKPVARDSWHETPMVAEPNDVWRASFRPEAQEP